MPPVHDYVIDNSTGANVRSDINSVLQAILSNNSSSSAPSTTAAYMFWADTTSGTLKIRNSSDNAWVELLQLDGTLTLEDGSVSTPALAFRDDLDTGIFSSAANSFNIATAGVERIEFGTTECVVNDGGADVDFRVEGDTNANLFKVDAGNDRVGIGLASPTTPFHVYHATINGIAKFESGDANAVITIADNSGEVSIRAQGDQLAFNTSSSETERMRIDSSGRLLIGTTTNTFTGVGSSRLQVSGTGADTAGINLIRTDNGGGGAFLQFTKNRGSATQSGDTCGAISWMGHDGTDVESYLAMIRVIAGATATSNSMTGDIVFETANGSSVTSERMRLDSSGNLGIGTTSPANALDVQGGASNTAIVARSTDDKAQISFVDNNTTGVGSVVVGCTGNELFFASGAGGSEGVRLDGSSRFMINMSTSVTGGKFQVNNTFNTFFAASNDAQGCVLQLEKTRSTSPGSYTIVQDGDKLGELQFKGSNGSASVIGANIQAIVNGTPGSGNDLPTDLAFRTMPDGSGSTQEAMRIRADGTFEIALNGAIKGFSSSHINSGAPLKIYKSSGSTHAGLQLIWDHFNTNTGIKQKIQFTIGDDASSDGFNNAGYVAIEKVDSWQSGAGRSAALVFATTSAATESEKMRITGSGLMLLGSSSTNGLGTTSKLQIQGSTHSTAGMQILMTANDDNPAFLNIGKSRSTGNAILGNNDDVGQITFFGNDGSGSHAMAQILCSCNGNDTSDNDLPSRLRFFTLDQNTTNMKECLRLVEEGSFIQHGGVFYVTSPYDASTAIPFALYTGGTSINSFGSVKCRIHGDGDIENVNGNYGSISDIKLKENIVDANSQWDDIKAIKIRNYNFKAETTYSTHTQIGVIAQELELVCPKLVTESTDIDNEGNDLGTVTKSVNLSVLYMKAVKCLQEAMTKIEVLETKVAALEAG